MMNRWKVLPLLGFITTLGSGTTHAWQLPPVSQESEQSRQNAENNRKYIAGLVERCETELKGKDAKQCYEWASNPPQWTSHQGKGNFHAFPEILDKAYTLAIERDPTFAPAYLARGVLLKKEIDLTKAIEIAPNYVGAYMSRGYLRMMEQPKLAESDFSKAIKLLTEKPVNEQMISGLSIKLDAARTLSNAYQYRSQSYLLMGEREKALEDMSQAIARWLENDELRKENEHAASEWMLQLAWASVVHPDGKVRHIQMADQCMSKAKENAAKEPPEDQGYMRMAY